MNKDIAEYIEKYPDDIKSVYVKLHDMIIENCGDVEEKLWAKLPSYYVGEKFIRLIPFKDHINIEASSVCDFIDKLDGYKITPKGMLQIYVKQEIPQIMPEIFISTLN